MLAAHAYPGSQLFPFAICRVCPSGEILEEPAHSILDFLEWSVQLCEVIDKHGSLSPTDS
jgi:hypothetical protein